MARARNKVARLPRELRQLAAGLLMDGATYEQIRAELSRAGCPADDLPGNNAFTAYAAGAEFTAAKREWQQVLSRAKEKSLIATALAQGGIEEAANLVTFEALDAMHRAIRAGGDEVNPAEFARLSVAVIKAGADAREQKLKAELASLKAELEAGRAKAAAAGREGAELSEASLQKIHERLNLL